MKISTKGEYGLRAMIELAIYYGQGYLQSADIAEARDIPENYLYQLLITLRKAGLIQSRRGPQGGHMLARTPDRITVSEVIMALEGPIEPTVCTQEGVITGCPFLETCAMREVWEQVTEATHRILMDTTIADLVAREREKATAVAER
jgi:Rrf2 family transcriptional regulator, cysteine metabolism repressor